ncbi:Uncharacterized protein dnm_071720 [Desulfonema magnum]|uniref:Uncharacterized protein n=1 Tax=Desulfonema magnum TaxID=45655 RepID=A0A975GRN9_9BACT|nr:Uncharacterized protein dnm_071720 [Desulfonema magnum]
MTYLKSDSYLIKNMSSQKNSQVKKICKTQWPNFFVIPFDRTHAEQNNRRCGRIGSKKT